MGFWRVRETRSTPILGRLMDSIWGWVFSFFIGEPVAMFLMCSYMKFALYASPVAYVTSSDIHI